MKYQIPNNQDELLPNKLGLTSLADINLSEFEGFLKAEIILSEALRSGTKFNLSYILNIHKLALFHLYSFAGKYRDVNIRKEVFHSQHQDFLAIPCSILKWKYYANCQKNIPVSKS